ncbi:MAG: hypothetical protein HY645_07380 [Acidobacteria bacterium]|nr:hypothetical protein [Acidobacteriota bacterium]
MNRRNKVESSKRLARALRRFERWRQTRKSVSPIPKALWASAVEAARECGVNAAAQKLRLDYNALKKRFQACPSNSSPAKVTPAFVELIGPHPGRSLECILELEDVSGARMRISLKGAESSDLAALSRALWKGEA